MMKNVLKKKLKAGEQTFGLWMSIPSPDVTERLAQYNFDWFVFDNEHSPLNELVTQTLLIATEGTGVTPLFRVAWNDPVLIKRALDIGSHGVVVPWVDNKQQAIDAVKACMYPPKGIRGCGPRRASYLDSNYLSTANDEVLVIIQIETINAVNNIDDIITVDGVDCFFIGPADLSASMNLLGKSFDPKVQEAIDKAFEAGKKYGVPAGIYGGGGIPLEERIKQGWQFQVVGSDFGFVSAGAREILKMCDRL
jgi:2-keto-3-deoxy-L-rhamnonate aldolase RhmA